MKASRTFVRIAVTCVLAAASGTGCEPKLTGPSGGGNGDDGPAPTVPTEARVVGNLIALHMDLIQASLSKSADFDTGGAVSPIDLGDGVPSDRSIFTQDCITFESEVVGWSVRLDACVDADGTEYRGGGVLIPITSPGFDGYYFWPYGDPADMIIATNANDTSLNHTYSQGNLQLLFQRGAGAVSGVEVTNWVIHRVGEETVSLTYSGVEYGGGIGSHDTYPKNGGTLLVSGDYMSPPFELTFSGGSVAAFTFRGVAMTLNLDSGQVQLAAS